MRGWSDSQLERIQRAWETLDLLAALEAGLVGERASGIVLWDRAHRSDGRQIRELIYGGASTNRTWDTFVKDYLVIPFYKLTSINEDELLYLKSMQRSLETLRGLRHHRPWDGGLGLTNRNFLRPIGLHVAQELVYLLSSQALPNSVRAIQTALRTETQRQLTLTAIAIQRYQLRHHAPPLGLGALCPEFLNQPAYDPMSGQALGYRVGTNANGILFSAGEDAVDNGGDSSPASTNKPGLWEGRDAVWPKAEN
jgi:hypothetical protein